MVDSYGTCPYILARVSERSGPSKLLVRGSHGCSPANLEQALVAEVSSCSFTPVLQQWDHKACHVACPESRLSQLHPPSC